jgi:hypothetical protein
VSFNFEAPFFDAGPVWEVWLTDNGASAGGGQEVEGMGQIGGRAEEPMVRNSAESFDDDEPERLAQALNVKEEQDARRLRAPTEAVWVGAGSSTTEIALRRSVGVANDSRGKVERTLSSTGTDSGNGDTEQTFLGVTSPLELSLSAMDPTSRLSVSVSILRDRDNLADFDLGKTGEKADPAASSSLTTGVEGGEKDSPFLTEDWAFCLLPTTGGDAKGSKERIFVGFMVAELDVLEVLMTLNL